MKFSYILSGLVCTVNAQNFDPKFLAFLKDRLKHHILSKPTTKDYSSTNLKSVVDAVGSIKDILIDNDNKVDALEVLVGKREADFINQKNINYAKFSKLEEHINNGLLTVTKAAASESERIDEVIDLIKLNNNDITENYNSISENSVNSQIVENQVSELSYQVEKMKNEMQTYIEKNNQHLDNLINDFKNFMANTKPFYSDFSKELSHQINSLENKVDGLEQDLVEEALENVGPRSFGSDDSEGSGSLESLSFDNLANSDFMEDLDSISDQLEQLGSFFSAY